MSLSRPDFPRVIDNSMRTTFVSCPQKFNLNYMQNWVPGRTNEHLQAGAAFAHGLEVTRFAYFDHGKTQSEAVELGWRAIVEDYGRYDAEHPNNAGYDTHKTCERMAGALLYYFDVWPFESDFLIPVRIGDRLGVEVSFTLPIDLPHPQTGEPLLYYGRFDMLAQHRQSGEFYMDDEKTASQLGNSWVKQWRLASQFTGYAWAMREMGYPVTSGIIRGISILKTGYNHGQALVQRPKFLIERWYEQLLRDIKKMIECWDTGYFDHNYGPSCSAYGNCSFLDVCAAQNPETWLADSFTQRIYAPWEKPA